MVRGRRGPLPAIRPPRLCRGVGLVIVIKPVVQGFLLGDTGVGAALGGGWMKGGERKLWLFGEGAVSFAHA